MKKLCAVALVAMLLPTVGFAADTSLMESGKQVLENGSKAVKDDVAKAKKALEKHMPGKTPEYSQKYMKAMKTMHKPMMEGIHASDPDVAFVKGMIPHHEGAIEMAKIELEYGKDPELQKLAEDIINAQDKEILFMNTWLKKNASMANATMK